MAKFNAKENDPERYARVKEEQAKLQTRCKSELRLARADTVQVRVAISSPVSVLRL